jgi:tetratricopeptide (TPR) repeat protein
MNTVAAHITKSHRPCHGCIPALLLVCALMSFPLPAHAAAGKALSPYTYKTLTSIQQQMDQGQDTAALTGLQKLLGESGLSAFERAVTQQMLGYVQINRGAYAAAVEAFERSLALQQLPETTEQNLRYNLGQLYLEQDQPDKAIVILETWFDKESSPSAEAHVLLAQALAQKKLFRKAIPLLQKANNLSGVPHAEWYEALLAMHYELQSYRDCVPLLKEMLRLFPENGRYWQQLASVYMALNDPDAALAALELAFRNGVLGGEQSLLQLAQLYLASGVPYKAARLLEQQLQSGAISNTAQHRELLAHAWSSARERTQAISALERALQDKPTPELRLRLAQWYVETGDWRAVTEVLAPFKGMTNDRTTAQARLLLGMACFELGDTDTAREVFTLAREFAKTRQSAQQWLDFIDSLSVNNVLT